MGQETQQPHCMSEATWLRLYGLFLIFGGLASGESDADLNGPQREQA